MDNMWDYWRNKFGVLNAFEQYYKDKVTDEIALAAYRQAIVAICALEARMEELIPEEEF